MATVSEKVRGLNLPRLTNEDQTYQDRVNAEKARFTDHWRTWDVNHMPPTAVQLATEYVKKRDEKEELEKQVSELQLQLTALEQLLIDQYEVEGCTSCKTTENHNVGVQYETYARVTDREKFRQWCIATGLESQLMLPWQTTNAITKQALMDGETAPEGVDAFMRPKIVLRRG